MQHRWLWTKSTTISSSPPAIPSLNCGRNPTKILLFLFLPYFSPSYLLKVKYIRILWMMHICCHICQSRDNLRISRHYRERQLYWWDQPGTWLYHQAHHRIASQKPKLIKIRDEEENF